MGLAFENRETSSFKSGEATRHFEAQRRKGQRSTADPVFSVGTAVWGGRKEECKEAGQGQQLPCTWPWGSASTQGKTHQAKQS